MERKVTVRDTINILDSCENYRVFEIDDYLSERSNVKKCIHENVIQSFDVKNGNRRYYDRNIWVDKGDANNED